MVTALREAGGPSRPAARSPRGGHDGRLFGLNHHLKEICGVRDDRRGVRHDRVARLMKLAHRDTGHMEPVTWVRDTIGSPSVGDTVTVEMSGDAVLIGFETGVTAPMPWFRNLSEALPDGRFMAASWNEDLDYSVTCAAEGGVLTSVSVGDTAEEIALAKDVVAGKVSQDDPEMSL